MTLLCMALALAELCVLCKGTPSVIKSAKIKVDEPVVSVRSGDIQFISWRDKRQVNLATTLRNDKTFWKQMHNKVADEHVRTVAKPVAIELYTRFMGGVDRADQKLWTLLPCH